MVVDINSISINVEGDFTPLDYADMLQELADEIDIFRRTYRNKLSREKKDQLRCRAEFIRDSAVEISNIAGIEMLEGLDEKLKELKNITKELDNFLTRVENIRGIISALADIFNLINNILRLP